MPGRPLTYDTAFSTAMLAHAVSLANHTVGGMIYTTTST